MSWIPSSWFLSEEEVAKGREADARLAELDRQAYESGRITAAEYARRERARGVQSAETYLDQVDEAFATGWDEGAQNVRDTIRETAAGTGQVVKDVVGAPVLGIVEGLPWWAWLIGILAVAAWLGFLPGLGAAAGATLRRAWK